MIDPKRQQTAARSLPAGEQRATTPRSPLFAERIDHSGLRDFFAQYHARPIASPLEFALKISSVPAMLPGEIPGAGFVSSPIETAGAEESNLNSPR